MWERVNVQVYLQTRWWPYNLGTNLVAQTEYLSTFRVITVIELYTSYAILVRFCGKQRGNINPFEQTTKSAADHFENILAKIWITCISITERVIIEKSWKHCGKRDIAHYVIKRLKVGKDLCWKIKIYFLWSKGSKPDLIGRQFVQ